MKKTTISNLYVSTMISYIFYLICGIVCFIIMVVNCNKIINIIGKIWGIIFLVCVICGYIFVTIISLNEIRILLKDLKSLKKKNYITIAGKVVRFKKNIDPDTGIQINNNPIILALNTNEKIELIINDKVMIGEKYKFSYLKNSKIAEIIEKIE